MAPKSAPITTYLLAVFSIILTFNINISLSFDFIMQPMSVNVSLNSTVTFTCVCEGDITVHIAFYVGDVLASDSHIEEKGFVQDSEYHTDDETRVTRSLNAIAHKKNNNTNISCKILNSSPIVTSLPAVLMIQGILDGVGDLTATAVNGSTEALTWTPPYSLDNVPINGYNIITSDGINITVNTPYHILTSSDPDPCNITTVSVGAINDVGTSQYNNVSFYYSVIAQTDIASRVQINHFTLSIFINISDLCIGERPGNITIDVIYSGDIINSTDISMISSDQLIINEMITIPDITDGRNFTIDITLFNVAGKRSYSIPLVHLGPVNNLTSLLINCFIISVSWERPSVSDGVNIHNYTLLIYRDDMLVNKTIVKGSTTSYQFMDDDDDDLFNHEYTYVIYGSNELGEGDYSNGTFSYPMLSQHETCQLPSSFTLTNTLDMSSVIPTITPTTPSNEVIIIGIVGGIAACGVAVWIVVGLVLGLAFIIILIKICIKSEKYKVEPKSGKPTFPDQSKGESKDDSKSDEKRYHGKETSV